MDISEVATVKLIYFLCRRENNNDADTFVAGYIQQFLMLVKLLQFGATSQTI